MARLWLDAGQVVAAATLAEAVWDGAPPTDPAPNLHALVSKIRRALNEAGVRAPAIRTVAPGYLLDLPETACDAGRFELLLRSGRAALAHGDPRDAATMLQTALALWHGPAFAGLRWFDDDAGRLASRRAEARSMLVDAQLELGESDSAAAGARELLIDDRYAEPHWCRLISALARGGRTVAALDTCRQAREVFRAELGLDPGPELRELEQRLYAGEPDRPRMKTTVATTPALIRGGRLRRVADGAVFPVGRDGLRIGRAPDNGLVLHGDDVSRYHAEIVMSRVGLELRDLGSLNLTTLRGADLARGATELLGDGDEIRICGTTLIFEAIE